MSLTHVHQLGLFLIILSFLCYLLYPNLLHREFDFKDRFISNSFKTYSYKNSSYIEIAEAISRDYIAFQKNWCQESPFSHLIAHCHHHLNHPNQDLQYYQSNAAWSDDTTRWLVNYLKELSWPASVKRVPFLMTSQFGHDQMSPIGWTVQWSIEANAKFTQEYFLISSSYDQLISLDEPQSIIGFAFTLSLLHSIQLSGINRDFILVIMPQTWENQGLENWLENHVMPHDPSIRPRKRFHTILNIDLLRNQAKMNRKDDIKWFYPASSAFCAIHLDLQPLNDRSSQVGIWAEGINGQMNDFDLVYLMTSSAINSDIMPKYNLKYLPIYLESILNGITQWIKKIPLHPEITLWILNARLYLLKDLFSSLFQHLNTRPLGPNHITMNYAIDSITITNRYIEKSDQGGQHFVLRLAYMLHRFISHFNLLLHHLQDGYRIYLIINPYTFLPFGHMLSTILLASFGSLLYILYQPIFKPINAKHYHISLFKVAMSCMLSWMFYIILRTMTSTAIGHHWNMVLIIPIIQILSTTTAFPLIQRSFHLHRLKSNSNTCQGGCKTIKETERERELERDYTIRLSLIPFYGFIIWSYFFNPMLTMIVHQLSLLIFCCLHVNQDKGWISRRTKRFLLISTSPSALIAVHCLLADGFKDWSSNIVQIANQMVFNWDNYGAILFPLTAIYFGCNSLAIYEAWS